MALLVELAPAQEQQLQDIARQNGVSVGELVARTLTERFSSSSEDAQALALIEQWISEALTSIQAIHDAESDLREFQQAINETRRGAGARVLYPETQQ